MPATDAVNTRERYHRVLRAVDHQTSPCQSPGATLRTLKTTLAAHGQYEGEGIAASLRAAVERADVVTWTDADGRTRHTRATAADLHRAARYAGERGLTDAVATLNTALARTP